MLCNIEQGPSNPIKLENSILQIFVLIFID